MLRLTPLLGLFGAALAVAQVDPLPDLPDPLGRAGMMAAVLREADGSEVIVATGGTNFPDKMPWQGGQRKYHKDILKLSRKDGVWSWHKIGDLPEGLVGAAFCPTPKRDGLVIAGGASADGHRADVWLIGLDGKVTRFAESMTRPRAYAGFTSANGHLIVIGGIARPDDMTTIQTLTSLDLDDPDKPWRTTEVDPSYGRIIPLVGAGLLSLDDLREATDAELAQLHGLAGPRTGKTRNEDAAAGGLHHVGQIHTVVQPQGAHSACSGDGDGP
jgi:hypothetical protein